MWSLPDINRLNAEAASNTNRIRREAARERKPQCEIHGCTERASESTLWFDVFSEDPKGVIHTCSDHSWEDDPDLFRCENCERVMVDHYTYERYSVELHGDVLCLQCAAKRYFGLEQNWIEPHAVRQVRLERRDGPLFDRETGVLNIARCRHVLAVRQPLPSGIAFFDNAEFDCCIGHQISGDNLLSIIQRLDQPFCPVLDATYQFAVSIGIYIRSSAAQQEAA
jgi:hypothetical protein